MNRIRSTATRLPAFATALLFGLALLLVPSADAVEVISTTPGPYELNVPQDLTTITIVFDQPVIDASADRVRVAGDMSGPHPGSIQLVGNTIVWTRAGSPFFPGDMVSVNLDESIQGGTLTDGHFFAFTIATPRTSPEWVRHGAYSTGQRPLFIHGGDLDNDGAPDVALPNAGANTVSVLLNASGGSFPTRTDYPVGTEPSCIYGDDLNDDGWQDLATADLLSSTISILINNGDGTFAPAVSYPSGSGARQIHGGDLDGDNDVDLCSTASAQWWVYLHFNNGDGTFTSSDYVHTGYNQPFAVRTGDWNGDGLLDFLATEHGLPALVWFRNLGGGEFHEDGGMVTGGLPWCLHGNDFNQDGDFDFALVSALEDELWVAWLGSHGTESYPVGVYTADLDGDGMLDAISSNRDGQSVQIFRNDGADLSLASTLDVSGAGTYTWAHDLDLDGDLDLSIVDEVADSLYVYMNDGDIIAVEDVTGVGHPGPILHVAPNPMMAGVGTTIRVVGVSGGARAAVFEMDGRLVRRLRISATASGSHDLRWDGRDERGRLVAAGGYLVEISDGPTRLTRKVQVIR